MPSSINCTTISPACPVSSSIYGYYPSLGANAFFCAFFGVALLANLLLGIRYKTWTFMIALSLGCLTEAIGYVGRILLHSNPFSNAGFEIQICCLIMAPAFVSAAIYLTLKHITLCFGPKLNRFSARYYTWVFITADIFSLALQGCGGGIAATANGGSLLNVGTGLMMAGIVLQVVTLLVFGAFSVDFALRLSRSTKPFSLEAADMKNNLCFKLFLGGLTLAFITVFTRCVYRIAEMAGGWRNPIMQNETEFIALDSVMVMVATAALTVFHPGYCFPRLSNSFNKTREMTEKSVSEDSLA
jgi:RTA1 like protein